MKNTTKKSVAKLLAIGLLLGGTGAIAISQASAAATTTDATQAAHPPQMRKGPDFMKNVTKSVEKIDNGVVITLTTDDAATLTKLQDFASITPTDGAQDVTRSVVTLDNGVQITMTSTNADTVQKLQDGKFGGALHPDMKALMQNVTRSVENTDKGVVITLSSDDANTVKFLQDSQGDMPLMDHQK